MIFIKRLNIYIKYVDDEILSFFCSSIQPFIQTMLKQVVSANYKYV